MNERVARTEKKFNNVMLENARLRAKNELLEKQVHYFQDLFAKSTNQSSASAQSYQYGRDNGQYPER